MGLSRSVVPRDAEFDLYVVERGSRAKPRKVGTHPADKPYPQEITVDGKTYYFVTADLTGRWYSYTNFQGEGRN